MTKEAITMSQHEVERVHVIQQTVDTRGGQAVAARQLGISVRQVKRRGQRYRTQGPPGWCRDAGASGPRMPIAPSGMRRPTCPPWPPRKNPHERGHF